MTDKPLLTYFIPTYNRCSLLLQTLRSIALHEYNYTDRIEIVISDNCSSDSTGKFVTEFADDNPIFNVVLFRTPSNLSFTRNLQNVTLCNGKFVKIMSDHILLTRSIARHLVNINPESCSIIFINNAPAQHSHSTNQDICSPFKSYDHFVTNYSLKSTWLGSYILSYHIVDSFADFLCDTKSLIPHTHFLLSSQVLSNSLSFCLDFCKVLPVPRKSGYNLVNVFVFDYLGLVNSLYKKNKISISTLLLEQLRTSSFCLTHIILTQIGQFNFEYQVSPKDFFASLKIAPLFPLVFALMYFPSLVYFRVAMAVQLLKQNRVSNAS